jgi:UDP-N-acetylglucosamine 2-epimerase
MISCKALLTSIETPHLLMIVGGTNQTIKEELAEMFKELFSILKQKKDMKIILTTQLEDSTADFIQQIASETLGERFIRTDVQLTWSDLTDLSKRKIFGEDSVVSR